MLVPGIEIIISDVVTNKALVLTRVNGCEVESSWKTLTDTAKITMPRNITILNGNINDIIKRGSLVSIRMGFDGVMNQEFVGYVARVDSKIPFTIFCEDEMWHLKQTNFNKSFKNVKLKDIISYIYPGQSNVIDFDVAAFRIEKKTAAKVLADIKEMYGFFSYFKDQVLNVGFPYDFAPKNKVIHHFQRNIPEDGVSLEYKKPEDYKVRIHGVSKQLGGKVISYTSTDSDEATYNTAGHKQKFDGDEIQYRCPYLSKDQLKRIVDDMIKKYKIGGYKGTLKTFGIPFCRHGDIDHYMDSFYPEREGSYLIEKTTVTYNEDGYRRIIAPDRKVS